MAQSIDVIALTAQPPFPNNPQLPVLVYRRAFELPAHGDAAQPIEQRFERNGWGGGWRDGVYNYHHFHSTAHEVLGCYSGRASLQLGGPTGVRVEIERGDVIVLPAGATHKSLETSADFKVVGAYAEDRAYDMRRGDPQETPAAELAIAQVPLPKRDPVHGAAGPLHQHWKHPASSQ